VQHLLLDVDLEQLLQLALGEDRADVGAEARVETLGDGLCDDVEREQKQLHERQQRRADAQCVACENSLRYDLASEHDDDGREEEACEPAREIGHENRQQAVDGHRAQHECREQLIAVAANGENALCPARVSRFVVSRAGRLAGADRNIKACLVERHEPEREARKYGRQAHKPDDAEVPQALGQGVGLLW
jgi:hypothetical protein